MPEIGACHVRMKRRIQARLVTAVSVRAGVSGGVDGQFGHSSMLVAAGNIRFKLEALAVVRGGFFAQRDDNDFGAAMPVVHSLVVT